MDQSGTRHNMSLTHGPITLKFVSELQYMFWDVLCVEKMMRPGEVFQGTRFWMLLESNILAHFQQFCTWILDNWYKCVNIMKFRKIKPTGRARYAYEKLQFPEFRCFLSIIWDLYQICFLKNIRTSMGLIPNFIREFCITVVNELYYWNSEWSNQLDLLNMRMKKL